MRTELSRIIHHHEDQVLFVNLGPAEGRGDRVITALGKPYSRSRRAVHRGVKEVRKWDHTPFRICPRESRSRARELPDYMPARMVNEYVYCPRLFYYEWVESVFRESVDTVEGQPNTAGWTSRGELPRRRRSKPRKRFTRGR